MKTFTTLLFLISAGNVYSQCYDDIWCLDFEDTVCMYHLSIDTANFPNNIWEIGEAEKPGLDATVCLSNTIITDTANPYPVNNHSVFTLTYQATPGDIYGFRTFEGQYYVQTDSLKDYGTIEISLDKGLNWIDIMDTAYNNVFLWYTEKPVLTGHSITCNYFAVDFANLIYIQDFDMGDTIMLKFSFFSDSISDNSGGIVFDHLCLYTFIEGISEIHFTPIESVIYPNPSSDLFTIDFDNPNSEPFELAVYDIHSKRILTREGVTEKRITLDTRSFESGMYVYKITNVDAKKRCWGRFNVIK